MYFFICIFSRDLEDIILLSVLFRGYSSVKATEIYQSIITYSANFFFFLSEFCDLGIMPYH